MRLVLFSLGRPVTILIAVLAVVLASVLATQRMRADIFPDVGDPAIYVAQPYPGMDPQQMDSFLTYFFEYHFLYIAGIKQIESKSIQGAALLKLTFHQDVDMTEAMSQVVSYVNRAQAFMPPGTVQPFVTRFDAGSVPIGQLVFSSSTRPQAEIQDAALNRVRPLFATLPGVSAPPPFGGNARTIVIRLDPQRLRSYRLSPEQVVETVNRATRVVPSGNVRTDTLNRIAVTNSVLGGNLQELMKTPIRGVAGPAVYLRDVATIQDGVDILTAYAHVNGKRTVYIPVTKRANASTLDVIRNVRNALPAMKAVLPDDVDVQLVFDESGYVSSAIRNLINESVLGALLAGLMVLIFLRDWRSAAIVVATIPAALTAALVGLWAAGYSINLMTLGGLALAVGVLVDEATVTIENMHAQRAAGRSGADVLIEAARATAIPRLLAMLCVLAVLVPAFFMAGVAKQLFVPLALAVGMAMAASYVLSNTLVPVLAGWWHSDARETRAHWFDAVRMRYHAYVGRSLSARLWVVAAYTVTVVLVLLLLAPRIGTEIFPPTDGTQFQLRMRAATGTRIEETERLALKALSLIREEVGPSGYQLSTAYIGVQPNAYPVNTIHLWTNGPHEAVFLVKLTQDASAVGEALRERLRERFHQRMPEVAISFEAGDIISRVMSFGSPTPIEVAVQGKDSKQVREHAEKLYAELGKVGALRDLQFKQPLDYPTVDIAIDRDRAGQLGLSTADVAESAMIATSSSRFYQPNYWRDPKSGLAYLMQVEVPQHKVASAEDVESLAVMSNDESRPLLGDLASVGYGFMPGEVERFNGQRLISVTANIHGLSLGEIKPEIDAAIERAGQPPKGIVVAVRGQVPAFLETEQGLKTGLMLAVATIFLLLTAYFQSVRIALAIIGTVPAVLIGSIIALLVTATTLNVQSFMGMIMALGIAMANSILLVSFAERARLAGESAESAVGHGASERLRPILMTAFAMMAGMLPMALGLGEGGSQSAPLGRAVIGGVLAATFATLSVLPGLYAMLLKRAPARVPNLLGLSPTGEGRYDHH